MFLVKLCLLFLVVALAKGSANIVLHRESRAATTNPNALWPNGIIYYLHDSSVTELLGRNISGEKHTTCDGYLGKCHLPEV